MLRFDIIRSLSAVLLALGLAALPAVDHIAVYSGVKMLGIGIAIGLSCIGAIFLWNRSKSGFYIWLMGYVSAFVPLLLSSNREELIGDPWFWGSVPFVACAIVFLKWNTMK